jgi:hypothetical protein
VVSDVPSLARQVQNLDTSRRVAWAKYFDAVDEAEEVLDVMRRRLGTAIDNMTLLAILIVHNNRLAYDDPLVLLAQQLVNDVGSTPQGKRIVDRLESIALRWHP